MILKFRNNTFIEKPMGSKLVGIKRDGFRPTSIELDSFDLKLLLSCPDIPRYLNSMKNALVHDPRILNDNIK